MNKLTDYSLKRPVTTLIILFGALIFGMYAYINLKVELMPDVDTPIISITTILPGASPEVVDKEVTDLLEEQINAINGLKSIQSQSFEGRSLIIAEFELSRKIDSVAADVRAKVNLAKQNLPKDAEDSIVDKFSPWNEPFMILGVTGAKDYQERLHFADKVIKRNLQTINGVGAVDIIGGPNREIRIELNVQKMLARNVSSQDIINAIHLKHKELPGGRVENKALEYSLRIQGEYKNSQDLSELVIKKEQSSFIRLKDVAQIIDGFEDQRSIAELNGKRIISLQIQKQRGANEIQTSKAILERIQEISSSLPKSMTVKTIHDSSKFIEKSMKGVQRDLITGVLLTAFLMWLFLKSFRPTLIAVMAIPVSLISTFAVLYVLGISINNLSMLGISLSIGLVIDNTIVVIENVFRYKAEGKSAWDAAYYGTKEVFFSVLAGTITTVSVFLPVAFMDNMIGRYLYSYGMTIVVAIIISFIVSITLTPFLASHLLKAQLKVPKNGLLLEGLQKLYKLALSWAIQFRVLTILIATVIFGFSIFLASTVGMNFVPDEDQGKFVVDFELNVGASIQKSLDISKIVESSIKNQKEVDYYYLVLGGGASQEVNRGKFTIYLTPKQQRQGIRNITEELRAKLTKSSLLKDIAISITIAPMKTISLMIQGTNYEDLKVLIAKLKTEVKKQDFLRDVEFSLKANKPSLDIEIDRDLADEMGVDVVNLSSEVFNLVQGLEVSNYKEKGYRYKIRLRAQEEFRDQVEDILSYKVRGKNNQMIPLSVIAKVNLVSGANRVDRYNRIWAISLEANSAGLPTDEAVVKLEKMFADIQGDNKSIRLEKTGDTKGMQEAFISMLKAVAFSILIIYMVMAIQFESFINPIVVMMSLPLSSIGVFGLLSIIQMPMNILIFMGMILLVGIVVNNAIILVDFINQERDRGTPRDEAILKAAPLRLRPILMTALSTIVSIIPVALGLSEGGEMRQPMSIAVIGGMLTSSPLTLLVIPVMYSIIDDLILALKKFINSLKSAPITNPQSGENNV
ncbi:MAG: efflux RND transporter permease subunit [Candidatus Cloacimonetes bacterium]|nr:efflux RND transporter permease subunit [Candidatus Cloacimonadota bacterium]